MKTLFYLIASVCSVYATAVFCSPATDPAATAQPVAKPVATQTVAAQPATAQPVAKPTLQLPTVAPTFWSDNREPDMQKRLDAHHAATAQPDSAELRRLMTRAYRAGIEIERLRDILAKR